MPLDEAGAVVRARSPSSIGPPEWLDRGGRGPVCVIGPVLAAEGVGVTSMLFVVVGLARVVASLPCVMTLLDREFRPSV